MFLVFNTITSFIDKHQNTILCTVHILAWQSFSFKILNLYDLYCKSRLTNDHHIVIIDLIEILTFLKLLRKELLRFYKDFSPFLFIFIIFGRDRSIKCT